MLCLKLRGLSISFYLSPPSSKLLLWKKTYCCFASRGKKVQQKRLTNKRSIKYHNNLFFFISIYQSMQFLIKQEKIAPTT